MTGTGWRKSSYSITSGDCAEVADGPLVRDSKDPDGPVLKFTPQASAAFTAGDEFDCVRDFIYGIADADRVRIETRR